MECLSNNSCLLNTKLSFLCFYWQNENTYCDMIYNSIGGDWYWFLLAEISIPVIFLSVTFYHAYSNGLSPSQSCKNFSNSIKCISQLKGSTINSQANRESDQTCSNKNDLTGDTFNSVSGRFPFVFFLCPPSVTVAACQRRTTPTDSGSEAS